ncbi:translocase of outer mitochondrial membrane [Naganishia albida]|nr:translocase of outer mitochondrial membrane [Naganishia albida]
MAAQAPSYPAPTEKSGSALPQHPPSDATSGYLSALYAFTHPIAHPLVNTYTRFEAWKDSFGLYQPGTAENLTKEIKQTHLTNFLFDGARADLTKGLSLNPAFQVTHSFSLASATQPPMYNFGAIYADNKTFLQGGVDHTGSVTARANQAWSAVDTTKVQAQLTSTPGHSMIQIEHDHLGPHYSLNLRTINPSVTDLTGIHMVSFLHSVTPRLALGFETLIQHPQPQILETSTSYLAKLTSLPAPSAATPIASTTGISAGTGPAGKQWIATAQLQPQGILQTTYYQKLSPAVDVGLDLQTLVTPDGPMGPGKREATATLGAKYEFRMATFRGQVDSQGKVGMLLEQRFTPAFAFLVGGEIDHWKGTSKIGLGVMIESSSLSPEELQAQGMLPPA